ncbi:amino acid/polyamine transporter I [Vararia minispora EC-137]|uniref:Amino acid/polyamine transporter I n=1 Tax=Vararia minispora EC-137 TaxID=1314806 RepID=A0ACB8QW26_9AGAM|nr:amino acid/polyamine transporter I [Vararia minispora EC-137]
MADEKNTSVVVSTASVNSRSIGQPHDSDDIKLAQLGYRSEFKREFTFFDTVCFGFSVIGIIGAVSSTLTFPLISGGHFSLVWGWLIASCFVMTVAASLAELTSSMPTSAGLYYFSAKLAPPEWAPLASWITGWANVTGQIALLCSIEYTCALMITTAIATGSDSRIIPSSGATFGILLAILALHSVMSAFATKIIARLTVLYTAMNVGTSVAVIVAMVVCGRQNLVSSEIAWTDFTNDTGWTNDGFAFLLAFVATMWDLIGYDAAAHISEEVSGASWSAPMAILTGVGGSAILGWGLWIATSYTMVSIPSVTASTFSLPMGQHFVNVFGKRGALAVWSLIIVNQLMTGAASGVDASRAVFAFARDNALPGSRWLKRVNSYTRTPVFAVWFVMFWAAILGLLGFSTAALNSLAGASVVGLYSSYAIPIFLRNWSGRSRFIPGPFSLGKWHTLIGVIAILWIIFMDIVLMFPTVTHPTSTSMNYAVVIIGAVFVFSGISWILSARKWFKGPVPNIGEQEPVEKL